MELRALQPDDQPALWSLMQRIYPPAYFHFWPDGGQWYLRSQYRPEQFAQELMVPSAAYYFVCLDGKPVGILRTIDDYPLPERPDYRASKLHRLYLDQRVQGRGVGSQLMEWFIATRRQQGYELVWLDAMERAPAAVKFYQRFGFSVVATVQLELPLLYPGQRGMHRMARLLLQNTQV